MLLRRDIAEHRRSVPADHRRADRARDVIITRCDIRRQRAEGVKRRFMTAIQLLGHVFMNEMHRHMSRSLDHHLHIVLPSNLRQLAKRLKLTELGFVIGIRDTPGTQSVAERKRHVVSLHDLADLFEPCVKKTFLVMRETPLRHD